MSNSNTHAYPIQDCDCPDETTGGGTVEDKSCLCDAPIPQGYPSPATLQIAMACLEFMRLSLCEAGCLPLAQENHEILNYTAAITDPLDLSVYFDPAEPKIQYDVLWNGRKMYQSNNDFTVAGSILTWTLPKEDCIIEIVVRRYIDLKANCS